MAVKDKTFLDVRWMVKADLPEVLRLERASYDEPWERMEFDLCLRSEKHLCHVARMNGQVVGFSISMRGRTQYDVLNVTVCPEHRRQGLGGRLVDELKYRLRRRNDCIVAHVRETNLPAQLFFKSQKFIATLIIPAYFDLEDGSHEPAYRFEFERL